MDLAVRRFDGVGASSTGVAKTSGGASGAFVCRFDLAGSIRAARALALIGLNNTVNSLLTMGASSTCTSSR